MTGIDVRTARVALAPLCQALRDGVAEQRRSLLAEADETAAHLLVEARASANRILVEARAAGAADGRAELAAQQAGDRRADRTAELGAQHAAYAELWRQVAERIAAWCARPEVRLLLIDRARSALGADAVVVDAPNGGVTGMSDGRRLDLDADTITAAAIEGLGAQVARLWTP